MLILVKVIIYGLEYIYQNYGFGGMVSVFMLLEIIYIYYWNKENIVVGSIQSSVVLEVRVFIYMKFYLQVFSGEIVGII